MKLVQRTRVLLVRCGKVIPFVLCALAIVSYAENAFALATSDFLYYNGMIVLNKPISWFVGQFCEYNIQMLAVITIVSVAIKTCIYNKLACVYLGLNLFEKSYFDFELEPTYIYIICTLNIIVAGYLTFRGLKILLSK